ncbi:Arc family DNA-binding protein [Luteibacter sp. PPL201]|uniref:Arc family DNA-binding protein n=1 Tax=Luteibacter sahnii TaxID=3021977 RepID=A0ABT6B7R1_9GAMM
MRHDKQINVRIPDEDLEWLKSEMQRNRRSLTSEVVLAIQEKRERTEKKEPA